MHWEKLDQEPCPLARTLSVIGDRWRLIILRPPDGSGDRVFSLQGRSYRAGCVCRIWS